ncbi:heme-binding protein [Mycolicibacterium llatzerense]|uniref:heme-binding protein n=1 Tax=Mycolicibacterium llatzerense TaxID=280871 RepID=UPI0008DCAD41|nr:heme-binding protein [Mycolicibacterium llatzerense]
MNKCVRGGRRQRGAVVAKVVAGVATCAFALTVAGVAGAQPGDPCSPSAMMRGHAAVMNQMADYLDAHPDVEQAMRQAMQMGSPQERHAAMMGYLQAHPDVAADMKNIRQPMMDSRASCGLPPHEMPMMDGTMPGMGMAGMGMPGMTMGH